MPRASSHINFVAIKEIADRAIRRTAVFVALGLNSAKRCSEYDLELEEVRHLALLPEDPGEEVASICSEEFATWIITCGLRELLETFGTFLDEIDWACNGMRLRYSGQIEKIDRFHLKGSNTKGLQKNLYYWTKCTQSNPIDKKWLLALTEFVIALHTGVAS